MNIVARPFEPDIASGLPRRRWTVDELDHMRRIGIFAEHEKVELIAGDILINTDRMPEGARVRDLASGRRLKGVVRRLWTADELEKLLEAGILHEDDGLELIGGDLVIMSPKGNRHELLRNKLILNWARRLPGDISFAEETPLKLAPQNEPEPDIILFPEALDVTELDGSTVLLVVEIADSSLKVDRTSKAPLYASFGVREYWVIDAKTMATFVHLGPARSGYRKEIKVKRNEVLTPTLVTTLSVRLADLGIR